MPPLTLIGLPGAGKSSVASQLASLLNCSTSDSDMGVEQKIGMPIRDYFALHGEASFRAIESEVLLQLLESNVGVLATGGGVVLQAANRALLRKKSQVIYLHALPTQLELRLCRDQSRPLLQGGDLLTRLQDLYTVRDPLYRETAHAVVEVDALSIPEVAQRVLQKVKQMPAPIRIQ